MKKVFKKFAISIWESFYSKWNELIYFFSLRTKYRLHIMGNSKTLKYIINNKCSVSRYGDGEFSMIITEYNIGFQKHSKELAEKLKETLKNADKNLLICVPRYFNSFKGCTADARNFWYNWGKKENGQRQKNIVAFLRNSAGEKYCFGDALITRPYMDVQNHKKAAKIFDLLKRLWTDRDIIIVEGDKTRLGVGNDLFDEAKSIKRVLAPAVGAFDKYSEILEYLVTNHHGELVLIALGPTATVLAADLCKYNIQAIDIGHIDIEYEWFLSGAKEKIQIKGKFTNEAGATAAVSDCNDSKYLSQIIKKIGIF